MEKVEKLEITPSSIMVTEEDLCVSVLSRFSNSEKEEDQHLCAVVSAMSQELKDGKFPDLTPISYLKSTISSLNKTLSKESESDPSNDTVITAHLTFISMILPKISILFLVKKINHVSGPIVLIIRSQSSSVDAVLHWPWMSMLYEILLDLLTDSRPQVRKQSCSSLCDVLRTFQGTDVLTIFSEEVTNVFKRSFLPGAQGDPSTSSRRPRGPQDLLYILDALNDCLPLMSSKFINIVLVYFKSLLQLNQPIVTMRITDILDVLSFHPISDAASQVLVDLLCSLHPVTDL